MATTSSIPRLLYNEKRRGRGRRRKKKEEENLEFGQFSYFTNTSKEMVEVVISINVHLVLF